MMVHADTWVPEDAGTAVLASLRDRSAVGGGFWKQFRDASPLMIGSRVRCAIRLYGFGRIAGDQVFFVRRQALEDIGGVPDVPLMEEFELARLLRQRGRLVLAGATVSTSARRFRERGVVRTYLRMWRITLEYYLGAPATRLQALYEKK
jgi:hypothetical protein